MLTIDRRIQRLAEQALGNRNGSVVVLKPSTGEVLAMVSSPSFDPNRFFAADASDYFTRLTLDPFVALSQSGHTIRLPSRARHSR